MQIKCGNVDFIHRTMMPLDDVNKKKSKNTEP